MKMSKQKVFQAMIYLASYTDIKLHVLFLEKKLRFVFKSLAALKERDRYLSVQRNP